MLIDNFEKLNNIVEWSPKTSFYRFSALLRKKDFDWQIEYPFKKGSEFQIKEWIIHSQEEFEKKKQEMLDMVNTFNCRIYMNTDRKSILKTLREIRNRANVQLDLLMDNRNNEQSTLNSIKKFVSSPSAIEDCSEHNQRRYLFDIDKKDEELLKTIVNLCGSSYLETFQTKNGYHVVAKRNFPVNRILDTYVPEGLNVSDKGLSMVVKMNQLSDRKDDFEVKLNSMVLVAMNVL